MDKLKNKVFMTIFLILTISIISILFIFNAENYFEQKKSIVNSLNVASDNNKKRNDLPSEIDVEPKQPNENIRFMDSIIYTILLDQNDSIKEIINHSNKEITDSEINVLAKNILSTKNIKNRYIGCLYFNKYSYNYEKGNNLVILDNTNIKTTLLKSLGNSILILFLLEIVVFFVSKLITMWIIKPVKESFSKQKQFIADASHELKTPLSVIMASSEALEDSYKENKWVKNITMEANRMNHLITDLLELAKLEERKIDLQEGDLSKTIELSVLTFEGIAYEKNIKISYDIMPNIMMNMVENDINQLIEILLDNAIKHTKNGKDIKVSLKEINNQIEILVINEGDNIPKGEEEKIFERFYRVDKSRNRNTNRYGLGLAIAKNIVENHNGKISASSNKGLTTFKVLFKK